MQLKLNKLIDNYPALVDCAADIEKAYAAIKNCIKSGNKILVCGNGGSASDAEHIVGELMKGFLFKRELKQNQINRFIKTFPEEGAFIASNLQGAIPAISLANSISLSTAILNDMDADFLFAQQVFGLGVKGDVLIGISTSGNSKNVLNAVKVAKTKGLATIGLTGGGGGALSRLSDHSVCAPGNSTHEIQEYHLPIYHCLCAMLEECFFAENQPINECGTVPAALDKEKWPAAIELVVFDFDGVFTDNKVCFSQDGVESVFCDRADSLGINYLKASGIKSIILSTEKNPVVLKRAAKMGIDAVGGCDNKLKYLKEYLGKENILETNVLYMGNDLNDLETMQYVGFSVAPADAHPEILKISSLILSKPGGKGAVRELCDKLIARIKKQ